MSRLRYFAVRTLVSIALLFFIITGLFVMFRLMPGDYGVLLAEAGASPEAIENLREEWGLNNPLHVQYVDYILSMLHLDPGTSLVEGEPVLDIVGIRIFNSAILVAPAITIGYIIGSFWGTILAFTENRTLDEIGLALAIFIGTVPIFFAGILSIIVFGHHLSWFPTGGIFSSETIISMSDQAWWRKYLTTDFAWHYILPFSVLVISYTNMPTLLMRTNVMEIRNSGFDYYHRITGISKTRRIRRLARHASLPVITFYPLSMTRAIGGLVLLETVFGWPGIGFTLVEAVNARDYPIIQFVFFLVAAFILFANFAVDILYGVIDPRVTVGED